MQATVEFVLMQMKKWDGMGWDEKIHKVQKSHLKELLPGDGARCAEPAELGVQVVRRRGREARGLEAGLHCRCKGLKLQSSLCGVAELGEDLPKDSDLFAREGF